MSTDLRQASFSNNNAELTLFRANIYHCSGNYFEIRRLNFDGLCFRTKLRIFLNLWQETETCKVVTPHKTGRHLNRWRRLPAIRAVPAVEGSHTCLPAVQLHRSVQRMAGKRWDGGCVGGVGGGSGSLARLYLGWETFAASSLGREIFTDIY